VIFHRFFLNIIRFQQRGALSPLSGCAGPLWIAGSDGLPMGNTPSVFSDFIEGFST
jgi:hypothetical protein